MYVLDLFSGLGGFSQAFRERGHEIITIDNQEKFNPDLCRDIRRSGDILKIISKRGVGKVDIVLASPPCIEFTKASMPWYPDIVPDMALLAATIAIVRNINPKFYVIENVRGAVLFFKPYLGDYKKRCGSRYLWGNFPEFSCDHKKCCGKQKVPPGRFRAERRSKVPYEISMNLCLSIEEII